MARVLQSLRRVLGLNPSRPAPPAFPRTRDSDFSIFREGDRVVIHGKHTPSLSKPLRKGNKTDTRRGVLEHDAVIDGRVWDVYRAHQGSEYRISLPTLEDYVALTPRLVTPIYGADANLIVSLLDIHVAPPAEGKQPRPLEILESGTGHGSLTLHLARAIQAANSNPPPLPDKSQVRYLQDRPLQPEEEKDATTKAGRGTEQGRQLDDNNDKEDPTQKQWDDWRARRGAIIHTVDVSPKFSIHAEKTIRGFRRGIYAGCVDFYVGHVENWIAEQTKQRGPASSSSLSSTAGGTNILSPFVKRTPTTNSNPFLSYAILDMPSAHLRIPHVAPILKRNGMLVVFMPSITQIGDCVELIRRQRLPFVQDKVVELGAGLSGGRLWDVRFAMKKSRADPSSWNEALSSSSSSSSLPSSPTSDSEDAGIVTPNLEESPASSSDEAAPVREESPTEDTRDSVLVCRPKVGTRIVGGGFVGIWRRIEDISKE